MNSSILRSFYKGLAFITGALLGFVISYGAVSVKVAAMSPIGLALTKSNDPFVRVYAEMVRLGEAETVIHSCANKPNISSQQAMARSESDLITELRTDVKSPGLTPPLDLAAAIVELRGSLRDPKSSGPDQERDIRNLVRQSGWPDDSEATFKNVLTKLDGACQ